MTDPIELAASVMTTVSILLAARNSVHTWWTGIAGCALFAVTFYRAALYADVTLQGFFIVTSTGIAGSPTASRATFRAASR